MNKLASILSIAASLLVIDPAIAENTLICGLKPLPLRGCKAESARCVCDEKRHCQWVFTQCENGKQRPAGEGLVIDPPMHPAR